MRVLVVNRSEVAKLLPMRECIALMAEALRALARGEAVLPPRTVLRLPGTSNAFATMPAALKSALGAKVLSIFPGNHRAGLDSHQGAVLLFSSDDGRLLAILEASSITAVRTAAVSAAATAALAREDAGDLALIGSGVQAGAHLEAMLEVRRIRRVRVASREFTHAESFAARLSRERGVPVVPVRTVLEAVVGADLVCVLTSAREPVVAGEWLAPGTHVNAVGASAPAARELDTAAVARARLFVDRRESAFAEAGDFLIPRTEGAIGDDHIRGELGEVLIGRVPGRTSDEEVTLFKSLGLAIEDVAAAQSIYAKAARLGAGRVIEL